MPDTNEDNYESNYITLSVGMTDKQVVWFMGFSVQVFSPGGYSSPQRT